MSVGSRWLDMVVGVDLHFEIVPSVPSPVPFSHPFIGLVWDPVGLVRAEMMSAAMVAIGLPPPPGPVLVGGPRRPMKEQKHTSDGCGGVLIARDEVTEADFGRCSVWREYKVPDEFPLMQEHGATQDWIAEQIVDRLEEGDIWYALVDGQAAPVTEFMVVAANFWTQSHELSGYVTLVDGEIASGTIFHPHIRLSSSDLLDDENVQALEVLSKTTGVSRDTLLPIRYELDRKSLCRALWPIAEGVLDIALPSDSSGDPFREDLSRR